MGSVALSSQLQADLIMGFIETHGRTGKDGVRIGGVRHQAQILKYVCLVSDTVYPVLLE